jgi:hypothetical protein
MVMVELGTGAILHKELVSNILTWSPLFKAVVVNVLLFVPALTPFTCHWKKGDVPSLAQDAVKVTAVPIHVLLPVLALI